MTSSSEYLFAFARARSASDPKFAVIVAFDYYDGPEHGLALYHSGHGVRFSSLGDSRSRLFRAFKFIAIDGVWWQQISGLRQAEKPDLMRRIVLPSKESENLTDFESAAQQARALGQFVGVGSPDLKKLLVSPVTEHELKDLRNLGCSQAGFDLAHRFVKDRRRVQKRCHP
jgi:hypothetical protein